MQKRDEPEQSTQRAPARLWHLRYRWRGPLLCTFLILLFCEAAWLTFLTPGEADIVHYECYGLTFWLGSHGASWLFPQACSFLQITTPQPALHMLPIEYPPLTILVFSLPFLLPLPYYGFVFALLMTLSASLVYRLLERSGVRLAAPIFLFYLLLGTVGVFQERFDILPAACTLVCLLAAERGRWRAAYLALALGVLLKLYPLVMLPALFLAEQRAWLSISRAPIEVHSEYEKQGKHPDLESEPLDLGESVEHHSWLRRTWENAARLTWRNCLLCAGLLLVVTGAFALFNFQAAVLSPLTYLQNRPPQIEALAGSLIWLSSHFGQPYKIIFTYGSLNITGNLAPLVSPVNSVLTGSGLLLVFWLQWRRRLDLAQTLAGLVCVLIVTGKVFSPQYLIWLIPFLAVLAARRQARLLWMVAWAVISLLTSLIYLGYYTRLPDPESARTLVQALPGFFELVALRNGLLLLATLAFLGGWWKRESYESSRIFQREAPP